MSAEVIARDAEWSIVEAFLDRPLNGPRGLMLVGEAGIGKSTLWSKGVAAARQRFPFVAPHNPRSPSGRWPTELTSVAWLESQGPYQLPARLDDPANGGNGDGYVCAFPLPQAMADAMGADHTIYQFFENNLAAEGRP
jgi:hypothetical protein